MKLGIRSKLFLVSVGLLSISVVVANGYLSRRLDADLTARVQAELELRLGFVAREASRRLAQGPLTVASWDAAADELGGLARARVSLITPAGRVLGDSLLGTDRLERSGGVESHRDRDEVRAALQGQPAAVAMRLSATLGHRMLYVATPLRVSPGSPLHGVARLALPLTEVDAALARLRYLVLLATGTALGLAVVMSSLAAHWMSRIVGALTETARKMAAGDLSARTRLAGQDEVAELGQALDRLAGSLFQALDELRAERDLHSSILSSMQEGVLVKGGDGRVLLYNRALREMFALADDALGRPVDQVIRHAGLLGALQGGGEAALGEIDLNLPRPRGADGDEGGSQPARPARLLVRAAPLPRTSPDETGALLAVFVDVTDLRRLESVRKDFVANASHELRTPVAAIRSAAETLRGALFADPAAVPQFLDIIERNSGRLQDLVSDLLDLSRIESRQFALRLEAVQVEPLVEQMLPPFLERADKRQVHLRTSLPADLPEVRADRRALEQVLGNLVDNGVKYVGEGAEVRIGARADGPEVCLVVEDSGPGIEPRHLPRLFERFYRVDAGRSRGLGGTGLGLAIVKHLVEAMEGTVAVESTVGKGTRFTVRLPRSAASPPPGPAQSS